MHTYLHGKNGWLCEARPYLSEIYDVNVNVVCKRFSVIGRTGQRTPKQEHRTCHTHLLLVVEGPRDLVVVTRAEVDHDVLVAEEEHDGAGVVQLVHVVEVRHLSAEEKGAAATAT